MKIALFHNIETGGAKRAVYEHARFLAQAGHSLHLFCPTQTADAAFLPLAPLCHAVSFYDTNSAQNADVLTSASTAPALGGDESRARKAARRVLGVGLYETVRDAVWVKKQEQKRAALTTVYRKMADDINAGGCDVLYAHQCTVTLAPPLLRFVQIPTVFYGQDTLRRFNEWPVADMGEGARYFSSSLLRRSRTGRVVSPVLAAWEAREQEQFVNCVRAAPVVLVNSQYSREAFVKTSGVAPRVSYLGVDADFFCPAKNFAPPANEVLSLGALRPEKRHDFVISAVATIAPAVRPCVRVVGYGMDSMGQAFAEHLSEQAAAQKVDLAIEREVSDETVREAYRRASVFAFAPRLEPFGLVVLEALACGTPAVVANEGGPREIITNGVTGFIADNGSAAEFGAALLRITNDPALRNDMAAAGRADVLARWRWAQSGAFMETVLLDAAGKKRLQ